MLLSISIDKAAFERGRDKGGCQQSLPSRAVVPLQVIQQTAMWTTKNTTYLYCEHHVTDTFSITEYCWRSQLITGKQCMCNCLWTNVAAFRIQNWIWPASHYFSEQRKQLWPCSHERWRSNTDQTPSCSKMYFLHWESEQSIFSVVFVYEKVKWYRWSSNNGEEILPYVSFQNTEITYWGYFFWIPPFTFNVYYNLGM